MKPYPAPWCSMQKLPTLDLWPFSALSPILPVELGRQARKPSHFWMRMAFAVILGGILLATLWHFASYGRATFSNVPSIARFLFYLLTALGFFIPIQLPMLASGVLKREYETNRMLFLLGTPLSSIEILVGKVLASLIPAFEVLWIALPLATSLAVMSGIALLDWLLWNFSIALCLGTSSALVVYASIRFPKGKLVQLLTTYLLMMPGIFLLMVGSVWEATHAYHAVFGATLFGGHGHPALPIVQLGDWVPLLISLHPYGGILSLQEILGCSRGIPHPYRLLAINYAAQILVGTLALVLASRRLRLSLAQDGNPRHPIRARLAGMFRRLRPRLWENHPLLWKDLVVLKPALIPFLCCVPICGLYLLSVTLSLQSSSAEGSLVQLGFPVFAAAVTAIGFAREKTRIEWRALTWDSLFLTGHSPQELLRSKLYSALLPAWILVALSFPFWIGVGPWNSHGLLHFIEFLFETFVLLRVAAALGLWSGVDAKGARSAGLSGLLLPVRCLVVIAVVGVVCGGTTGLLFWLSGIDAVSAETASIQASLPVTAWVFSVNEVNVSWINSLLPIPGLIVYFCFARYLERDAIRRLSPAQQTR